MLKNQNSRSIGDIGEDFVCGYLKENGYDILERNFTIRGGEIDIVASQGDKIAFVEVKTRKVGALTSGEAAVTYTKKQRLIKTARVYIARKHIRAFCRFDVAVVHHDGGNVVYFKYYRSAFDASSK
ncbi:YraN family protein [Ruminococcus sp.]|uniref:YraN family protein n=1 Tax=Ruminococcus sp. TaxID=41978 RepID=UPI00258DE8F2|nr:YraN family protein [Ruminococcus sp.]MCR5019669.1 YraN family protein [Ruminococcus sp.]